MTHKKILIITGGRDYEMMAADARWFNRVLDEFKPDLVVHGDARGADRQASSYAGALGYKLKPMPADWKKNGKGAGPIRNREMLLWARANGYKVLLVAFPGGRGTANMVDITRKSGVPIRFLNDETAPSVGHEDLDPESQAASPSNADQRIAATQNPPPSGPSGG